MYFLDRGRVKPEEQTIQLGVDVHFICLSQSKVYWQYDGNVLPRNAEIMSKGHKLRIREVQYRNRGYYECEGITDEGERFKSRGLLKVFGNI